jgi:putative peptidoglycan lipid II flippase
MFKHLFKDTIIVTVFNGIGIALSFVINIFIAAKYGSGFEMDTYIAAIAFPTYIITIISGALNVTFIPVFSEYKHKSQEQAWKIVSIFSNFIAVCALIITILCVIFSTHIMKVLTPGFSGYQLVYSGKIFSLFSISLFVSILNELFASIYYANGKFVKPLLNKVLGPLITLLIIYFLGEKLKIVSLVYATIIGSTLQFAILFIGLLRNKDFFYSFYPKFYDKSINKILKLMLPLMTGMLIYKVVPLFDKYILSGLPPGSISYINYSGKIYFALNQLITTSISLTVFPRLADIGARSSFVELKSKMSELIRFILFISCPISLLLFLFSEPIIRMLFERGNFSYQDSIQVYQCFQLYLLSLPAVSIGSIVSQGFYVIQDTKTPAVVGVFEIFIYIALCLILINFLGFKTIPLVYAIYFVVSVAVLSFLLIRKLGSGGGKRIVLGMLKFFTVSIIIFIPLFYIYHFFFNGNFVFVLIDIFACLIFYVIFSFYLKIYESKILLEKISDFFFKTQKSI